MAMSWTREATMLKTLSTQESKNSRAACRAEPNEHSSMNCENICVRSSWEYSLWLERSRDLRKPAGQECGREEGYQVSQHSHTLSEALSGLPAHLASEAIKVILS